MSPKNNEMEVELEVGVDSLDNVTNSSSQSATEIDLSMDLASIESATDPETHPSGRYRLKIVRAVAGHTRTEEESASTPYPAAKFPGLPRFTVVYEIISGKGHSEDTLYTRITDMNQSYLMLPLGIAKKIMPTEIFMKCQLKIKNFCSAFKLPLKAFHQELSQLNYYAETPELAEFLIGLETNAYIGVKDAQGTKENFIKEWS